MSFISYNMNYYKNKIEYYENHNLNENEILEAMRLKKMVDDLTDEGYFELYKKLENDFSGMTRLENIIYTYNRKPFKNPAISKIESEYSKEKFEILDFSEKILKKSQNFSSVSKNGFLNEIINFCNFIGYDENKSYIFLLRDTFLPYLYFKSMGRKNLYPWLMGRKFFSSVSGYPGFDDIVRDIILDAISNRYTDFDSFIDYVRPLVIDKLKKFPEVTDIIYSLLNTIHTDEIIVVESGCYGTFPVLLACIDERIKIKMFTTTPFLYDIYAERIFTDEYEKNRYFETLYSQNLLMKYCDYDNKKFYVNISTNEDIIKKSYEEICYIINSVN